MKKLKNKIRNDKSLNENDFKHYPYTLTNIFEKIAVHYINSDEQCLKEIYNIRFKKLKYTQIELRSNKEKIFNIIVKTPKNDNKPHIKLSCVCGNKSSKKKLTDKKKLELLTIGGGRGQFIGFKLI